MIKMSVPPSLTYKFNVEALPLHTDEVGGDGQVGMGDAGRWRGAKQGRQDVEVPD